jgi:hypothetical protein
MSFNRTLLSGGSTSKWFEDFVILLTLNAFVIAQTVYDLLASNREFLTARGVTNAQLLAVIACYGLAPAAALWALWTACRPSAVLYRAVFAALIFAFSLGLSWQIRHLYLGEGGGLLHSPWWCLMPALTLAVLSWRSEQRLRTFLLALSPAILIFPALFLYRAWRSPNAPAGVATSVEASTRPAPDIAPNGTPVFMLVFDELALHALLDGEGKIDATLYPNFARLSGESHWFRNATSNSTKTITAIAAIVTGNMPREGDSNHKHYPNTIFSLLAPFYEVYIEEVGYTGFCDSAAFHCLNDATGDGAAGLLRDLGYLFTARVLPAKLDVGLPDTSHTWGPFQSAQDWTAAALARCRRVLHAIDALPGSQVLLFAHLILPHSPYALTPEGEIYGVGPYALDEGQDAATLASLRERYRTQIRYVDRWLGQFLDRLQQRGLFDPALLIVTGDHGVSWKLEAPGRTLREENADLMLPVPLFVKLPFQKQPGYSEQDVQHIDLAPTIAETLEMPLPFRAEGRSVFAPDAPARRKIAYGDDLARFEFDNRLAMRAVETHTPDSTLIGQSIERFAIVKDESVRGKLEAVQIAPAEAPSFAAALPVVVSGWALRTDPAVPALETESRVFRSGTHSLAFEGTAGGARQSLSRLTAGNHYRVSAWVRGAAGGRGHAALVVSEPGVKVLESAWISPATEFQPVRLDFTAPQGAQVLLELHYQDGPARIYWDDVSVRAASEPAGSGASSGSPGERIVNGGFEEALGSTWSVYGIEPQASPAHSFEVIVTLNGSVVGAARPGGERWDVATRLMTPAHRYLRSGWTVSIPAPSLREGENPLEAYAIIDPAKRVAVRLDSGWPRMLIKQGSSLDRKLP